MAVERQSSTLPHAQPSYILRGHASQVHSVQFVRQNTRLITGDADGWVIYWKLETKRALAVWKAHDGAILGTTEWAPDKIITHGRDNSLRIWQIRLADESGLSTALPAESASAGGAVPWLLHTLPVNTLNFCSFSMCYAPLATRVKDDSTVGAKVQTQSNEEKASILIAVPARDDKKAEVYQFPEERLKYIVPRAQPKDTGMVMAIKLAQKSTALQTLVLTGYEGGLTAVHTLSRDESSSIGTAQLVYLSQPHKQPILSLDVLPDATMYFTSGADAIVAAHRIPDLLSERGVDDPVLQADEDEDGDEDDPPVSDLTSASILASDIAKSGIIEGAIVAAADDPPISVPEDEPDEPFSFSKRPINTSTPPSRKPGGISSALSNEESFSRTETAARLPLPPLPSIEEPFKINNTKHAGQQSLSVRSDGRLLVTGGWDSRVRIYSTKTLKEVAMLKWHKEGVYAVAFAELLEASTLERSRWEVSSANLGGAVMKQETGLSKLQRVREEKMQVKHWLAAGAKDGKVSLWDIF